MNTILTPEPRIQLLCHILGSNIIIYPILYVFLI